jgi:hypothetical protein
MYTSVSPFLTCVSGGDGLALLVILPAVHTLALLRGSALSLEVQEAVLAVAARHTLLALGAQIGDEILAALSSAGRPALLVRHVRRADTSYGHVSIGIDVGQTRATDMSA